MLSNCSWSSGSIVVSGHGGRLFQAFPGVLPQQHVGAPRAGFRAALRPEERDNLFSEAYNDVSSAWKECSWGVLASCKNASLAPSIETNKNILIKKHPGVSLKHSNIHLLCQKNEINLVKSSLRSQTHKAESPLQYRIYFTQEVVRNLKQFFLLKTVFYFPIRGRGVNRKMYENVPYICTLLTYRHMVRET